MCCQQLKTHIHVQGYFFQQYVPIFRDYSKKNYPFLVILPQKHTKFSKYSEVRKRYPYSEPQQILKIRPIDRNYFMKNGTHFWRFLQKTDPKLWHIPVCLKWVSPWGLTCARRNCRHGVLSQYSTLILQWMSSCLWKWKK